MAVIYEWDVEEIADGESEHFNNEDIIDHYHQSSYADCLKLAASPAPRGSKWRIVLVRDVINKFTSLEDRSWAYLVDGKLPVFFEDAYNEQATTVPKRFIEEVERANA